MLEYRQVKTNEKLKGVKNGKYKKGKIKRFI